MKTVVIGNSRTINETIVEIVQENYQSHSIVVEIDNHPTAFDLMCLYSANLVIIDFTSTKNNSRIFISEIKELAPEAKIIVLNTYNQKTLINQLINAGASAYLHIDVLHKYLPTAIENVTNGENFIGIDNSED